MKKKLLFGLFLFSIINCFSQIDTTKSENSDVEFEYIFDDETQAVKKKTILKDSITEEESSDLIDISYINEKTTQSPDSLYFNVCILTNNDSRHHKGKLQFYTPKGWEFIGSDTFIDFDINPGETKYFPIRIALDKEQVSGGISYVVEAVFNDENDEYYKGATYITIPAKRKWDMLIESTTLFFNEYHDNIDFNIRLVNKGNLSEVIKLQLKPGKLIDLDAQFIDPIYISLPENSDTIINVRVLKKVLPSNQKSYYENIFSESVLNIKAETDGELSYISRQIWFRDLENELFNKRIERFTPLNIDLQLNNLLTSFNPRITFGMFGNVLFNNKNDFLYNIRITDLVNFIQSDFNVLTNPWNNNLFFNYKYDRKVDISAGHIFNDEILQNFRGLGIKGLYRFDDESIIKASYQYNPFFPNYMTAISYKKRVEDIGLSGALAFENNIFFGFRANSFQLGANFTPIKNHKFNLVLFNSFVQFKDTSQFAFISDTTLYGLTYQLNYNGKFSDRLFVNLNTRNEQFNHVRVRPNNIINANIRYKINDKSNVLSFVNYFSNKQPKYGFFEYLNGSFNTQSTGRILYNLAFNPKLSVNVGPNVNYFNRNEIIQNDSISSDFSNLLLGLFSVARIRLNDLNSISPSILVGMNNYIDGLTDTLVYPRTLTYNFGVNFFGNHWGFGGNYTFGPFLNIDQTLLLNNTPQDAETINLRVFMDRTYFDGRLDINSFANYYLTLPSNYQNFSFNISNFLHLDKGWTLTGMFNLFLNSRSEQNNISRSRFFSMNLGIRKSFEFDQPRITYYDVDFIAFKDMNGNGERNDNEQFLANIKMEISRVLKEDDPYKYFGSRELITSTSGQIKIHNLPQGVYKIKLTELENFGNSYSKLGNEFEIMVNSNHTIFIPYVESYRVEGRVTLTRDEYSTKGLMNASNVLVTVTSKNGETFTALTNNNGYYIINVIAEGKYKIAVKNVFGDEFIVDKEDYSIYFNKLKTYRVDFNFTERKRKLIIDD